MNSQDASACSAVSLRRVLGQWDLVLLFVVAVANLNVVPAVAASGPLTIWLWLAALVLFFWPQGIAVIELSHRYPEEGGVYLWTKKIFGDFHGFMSGWCYWTNNFFYVPTLLFYVVGMSVYVGGAHMSVLGNNRAFVFVVSLSLLWLIVWLNIRGLGVGKWVNNIGGIGTFVVAAVLIALAGVHWHLFGMHLTAADFRFGIGDWHLVSSFGLVCFSLVGLELASVMGDEIREPRRTLPRAVAWGGVLSGMLLVAATLSVLLALPQEDINIVQGILQAIARLASDVKVVWLIPLVAIVLSVATAGTTSAWLSGSARIPFVAGLDRYLPRALGRVHSRYQTPYVALIVHAILSCAFIAMSFVGATVQQAYQVLLLLAVVLQLIPFLYMYAALVQIAVRKEMSGGFYGRRTLWFAGISGFATTAIGMIMAFIPPVDRRETVWLFELKMLVGCAFFIGFAAFFFFVYSRRKVRQVAVVGIAPGTRGESL